MKVFVPGRMLPVLRRELSRELPEYGRARLCEAMAATLGYATHAAYKAASAGSPVWWISAFDLDPTAATRRLAEMGETVDEERVVGTFERVFRDAGVVQTASWCSKDLTRMLLKFSREGFGVLSAGERISLAFHLLTRRASPSDEDAARSEMRVRREHDLAGILVAALRTRHCMDPDAADLLIASFANPDEAEIDDWRPGSATWMKPILGPMRRRTEALVSTIVATWQGPIHPAELPPADERGFRDPRSSRMRRVGMVPYYGDGRDRISICDSDGDPRAQADDVLSMYAFAMFVRGDRPEAIRALLDEFRDTGTFRKDDRVLRRCMGIVPPHPSIGDELRSYYLRRQLLTLHKTEDPDRDVRIWFTLDSSSRSYNPCIVDGLRGDRCREGMKGFQGTGFALYRGAEILEVEDFKDIDQTVRDRTMTELCEVAQAGLLKVVIMTRDASLESYAPVLARFPDLVTKADFEVGKDVPGEKARGRRRIAS